MFRIAGLILLFSVAALARDHRAFNGTWVLIPAKSDVGTSTIQAGTVTINDREGNVTVSRKFTYEGAHETVFYADSTDGERNATIHSGSMTSKTRWEHDALKVTTTHSGVSTVETYTLAPDGTLIDTVDRPSQKTITLVFQHQ